MEGYGGKLPDNFQTDKDLRPADSSLSPMFYLCTNFLTTHV